MNFINDAYQKMQSYIPDNIDVLQVLSTKGASPGVLVYYSISEDR